MVSKILLKVKKRWQLQKEESWKENCCFGIDLKKTGKRDGQDDESERLLNVERLG